MSDPKGSKVKTKEVRFTALVYWDRDLQKYRAGISGIAAESLGRNVSEALIALRGELKERFAQGFPDFQLEILLEVANPIIAPITVDVPVKTRKAVRR